MELKDLVGDHVLTGVGEGAFPDGGENYFSFELDGHVYTAIEDEEDGYRSSMAEIAVDQFTAETRLPNVRVVATMDDDVYNEILTLTDTVSGQPILHIGTTDFQDYYPCFTAKWMPENMAVNHGQ